MKYKYPIIILALLCGCRDEKTADARHNAVLVSITNQVSVALRNAANIGYWMGRSGGTEADLDRVFKQIESGTNATEALVADMQRRHEGATP